MADVEKSLVVSLAEGITEGVAEEIAGGVITASTNTRLSVSKGTVTKAPAPTALVALGALECGGLVSNGRDSTVAYFRNGEAQSARYSDGTLAPVRALDGTSGQNAYFPYPLTESGAVPGGLTTHDPVVAIDANGFAWHFSVRAHPPSATGWGLFVTVMDGERVKVSPLYVTQVGADTAWFGATPQTDNVGTCVVVWYRRDFLSSPLCARRLSIDTDGATVAIGSEQTIVTPAGGREYADIASRQSGASAFAFMLFHTSTTSLELRRIDVRTWAETHVAISSVATAGDQAFIALTVFDVGGTEYVTAAFSDWTNFVGVRHYIASSLTLQWQNNNDMTYGRVAVQPFINSTGSYVVVACDKLFTGAIGTSGHTRITFGCYDLSDGSLDAQPTAPWYNLQSRGAYRKVSDAAIYPYFTAWPCFQADAVRDTQAGFVSDPSIEVFTLFDTATVTPVMRCAVDRAKRFNTNDRHMASNSIAVRSNELTIAYLEQRTEDSPAGWIESCPARFAVFDLAPATQPGYAADERGTALIASGLPAYWDGTETAEWCPLHRPMIQVNTTGGDGPTNLTGTYFFTAQVSWRDANNLVRRSAPAFPTVVTLSGTKPEVYVTAPFSMRNGVRQEQYEITVFATLVGGATFFAQPYPVTSKATNGCWYFKTVSEPSGNRMRLPSTGASNEPLLPQHPPPSRAAAVVGDRMYLIDAEDPYKLWPSLLKKDSVAYEFAGELAIQLPSSTGKALAVADLKGTPIIFCERGVLGIGGYGPDDSGLTGSFNEPQIISIRGCKSRVSVAQIPGGGLLYQTDDGRFALLGDAAQVFDKFGFYDVGAPVIFARESEIAYPLTDGTGWVAFNYLDSAWTKWGAPTGGAPTGLATINQSSGVTTALLYSATTGTFSTFASNTAGGQMAIARGWIAPEGPQGECVVRSVWLHARQMSAHGVKIRVVWDYDETKFVERTWTVDELTPLLEDGHFTLEVSMGGTKARAIKVTVTETNATGDAMRPLSLSIFYGANKAPMRRTLKQGAQK